MPESEPMAAIEIAVLRISPFGEITDEVISTERDGTTLNGLYRLIGCRTLALVSLGGFDMWLDEDGALNGSPLNPLATYVAVRLGAPPQLYLGTALFAGFDAEGSTTSLTDYQRSVIHVALSELMERGHPC